MAGKKYQGKDLYTSFWAGLLNGIGSLWNNITGAGTTLAQDEANAFTAQQAAINREFQHSEAQEQMAFQERMANTQYQRGVADMQAAGINPAIAYAQGGAIAPSGAAGAGSAGSSVAASQGVSMSDLMQMFLLPKTLKKLEAETAAAYATADRDTATAEKTKEETSWISADMLSQLSLREDTRKEIATKIDNILASTRGQEIKNEWSPKLLEQQFNKGEVEIAAGLVGIDKAQEEINQLILQHKNTEADIELKAAQRVLALASASLANLQGESVSLENWQRSFDNAFTEEFGAKPNQPIWNAVVGVLGKASRVGGRVIEGFFSEAKKIGSAVLEITR